MDSIESITVKKDTTLALLLAAQRREMQLTYFTQQDLFLADGRAYGHGRRLQVADDPLHWFEFTGDAGTVALDKLDVILMRKDPPFDMEFVYTTYILERAQFSSGSNDGNHGALVVNRPQSLRDANEKLFTAVFPQCCPPTLVTHNPQRIKQFVAEHGDVIVKPPDGMGGSGIFRLTDGDPNTNVILETVTAHGQHTALAQRFIPEISAGDKRILLVDGQPAAYALARMAPPGENRANLAVGGTGHGVPLSDRDRWICEQVGPTLCRMGLVFVGLDVIGDYLTEINVTSPTCVRELDAEFGIDIGADLIQAIERRLDNPASL